MIPQPELEEPFPEEIEQEHFEDFTTASDWEQFTASLEQLLAEWLTKSVTLQSCNVDDWVNVSETISFSNYSFSITFYRCDNSNAESNNSDDQGKTSKTVQSQLPACLQSIIDGISEFPPKPSPHPLSELFCLKEFAVITPTGISQPIQQESKLKVLLSSACVALNNTNSNFPIFVQYHHWNQNFFCGISESLGIRTSFQMIKLSHVPKQYNFLSGMLDLFKSKVGTNVSDPIGVSAHLFYNTNMWHDEDTFQSESVEILNFLKTKLTNTNCEAFDFNSECRSWTEEVAFLNLLPFGSKDDPYSSLRLTVGWPSLTDSVVVDTPTYSDLEPEQGEWYFGLKPKPDGDVEFLLENSLESFWMLKEDCRHIAEVLGKDFNKEESQFVSALDKITLGVSPLPVVNRVLTNVNKAHKQLLFSPHQFSDLPPISDEDVGTFLSFLFPDSTSKPRFPYSFDRVPEFKREELQSVVDGLLVVKSSPMGSLVWRLGIVLQYFLDVGGISAIAHVWAEFTLELRFRWENSIFISGLEDGIPNTASCLLNQKLQMLNCCIAKKLSREKDATLQNTTDQEPSEDSEDEDEFFDCEDLPQSGEELPELLHKPLGRLNKFGRIRLLKTGEPLYVPITQDPAPMTEDGFEEQTKILVEMGDDTDGKEQRAKLMSVSLASDMQSFKAANPGSVLEDFVRWYSPRDWIESNDLDEHGNEKGELSLRMKMPGNLWHDVWSSSSPIPARRQKRLFDDTREAEKILSWLSGRRFSDLCHLIFPTVVHASTLKVLEEADQLGVEVGIPSTIIHQLVQLTRSLGNDALRCQFNNELDADGLQTRDSYSQYDSITFKQNLISYISLLEKEICQIRSFQLKFPNYDVKDILRKSTLTKDGRRTNIFPDFIKVDDRNQSPVAEQIRGIFRRELSILDLAASVSNFRLGEPVKKVFVLKYIPERGSTNEEYPKLPQRMCCIKTDELLVAGTFSTQTDLG